MKICLCKNISDKQIYQAIEAGHTSRLALMAHLKVGTGCGQCLPLVDEMLSATRQSSPLSEPLLEQPIVFNPMLAS